MTAYAVFTTPRSKSTTIYRLLFEYYLAKYPKKCCWLVGFFSEYRYNRFFIDYLDDDNFLYRENISEYKPGAYREEPSFNRSRKLYMKKIYNKNVIKEDSIRDETFRRLQLLKKPTKHHYFLKMQWNFASNIVLPELADTFKIVCVNRTDKLEQFLELSLSQHIGIFHSRDTNKFKYPKKGEILLHKNEIDFYISREKEYENTLANLSEKTIIEYNKANSIEEIYDMLGITDWKDYVSIESLQPKMLFEPSYDNLEKYFSNINEIKDWVIKGFYKS